MSFEEHMIENAILKERRSLIDSGIECKFIKICGNSLYVKNKLLCLVQESKFQLATNSSLIKKESISDPAYTPKEKSQAIDIY